MIQQDIIEIGLLQLSTVLNLIGMFDPFTVLLIGFSLFLDMEIPEEVNVGYLLHELHNGNKNGNYFDKFTASDVEWFNFLCYQEFYIGFLNIDTFTFVRVVAVGNGSSMVTIESRSCKAIEWSTSSQAGI